ncbi:MAG: ABC transporter ATP-binding protein [Aigarchaeota archaeon]|nr:ABC transporter ATP-binding protein [Aigarchaeota archaeon]MDW8092806.1 ABC transporter ATP-binding protein [Nitrososphaerota archaeon]
MKVTNLVKHFRSERGSTVNAVDNVSFTVPSDNIMTLLGPSGCGKTTTLRCISGLEKPDDGEIAIGDRLIFSSKDGIYVPPEERGVGMVFQTFAIWPHMKVFDNIAFPLKIRGYSREEMRERVKKVLELVRLSGLEERPAVQLSGGQQQRVALARALVYEPSVLLLDEPLSNLDAKVRESLRRELRELLKRQKITAIYVTHDQMEALTISDMVAVMNSGKIIEVGTPTKLYREPTTRFVAEFLGSMNIMRGKMSADMRGIETSFGVIHCELPVSTKNSNEVYVCIRPEEVRVLLDHSTPRGSNTFKARVASSYFEGERTIVEADVNGLRLRAHLFNVPPLATNQEIYINLPPEKCRVLQD